MSKAMVWAAEELFRRAEADRLGKEMKLELEHCGVKPFCSVIVAESGPRLLLVAPDYNVLTSEEALVLARWILDTFGAA